MSAPTPSTQKSDPQQTLYFAYGSNLSLYQMSTRCPTSTYFGFGILPSYRWIISGRGYANVVHSPKDRSAPSEDDTVEGLLYYLQPADEARLDIAEGVPHAYTKHILDITIPSTSSAPTSVPKSSSSTATASETTSSTTSTATATATTTSTTTTVRALVYVDLTRTSPGTCKEEYVARMNRGIRNARSKGMTERYVQDVLRSWVRDEPVPEGGDGAVDDPFALGEVEAIGKEDGE